MKSQPENSNVQAALNDVRSTAQTKQLRRQATIFDGF